MVSNTKTPSDGAVNVMTRSGPSFPPQLMSRSLSPPTVLPDVTAAPTAPPMFSSEQDKSTPASQPAVSKPLQSPRHASTPPPAKPCDKQVSPSSNAPSQGSPACNTPLQPRGQGIPQLSSTRLKQVVSHELLQQN